MEGEKNVFTKKNFVLSLIILGWILCAYLFFRYTQLKTPEAITTDFCKAFLGSSCDRTLSSSFAWQLGFPLPGWGLAYFGLLGLLCSFRNKTTDRFVIVLAAFSVGVSCILTAMIIRSNATCPLCLVIHFINLLVLITLFFSTRPSISFSESKSMPARRSYLTWGLLLFCAVITGGFTEARILKSFIPEMPKVNFDEVAKKLESEKVYNFASNSLSPHLGSTQASVQLVVFSSFQCPACKGFASSLKTMQKTFGKDIGITFKNFPLSTKCSPRLSHDMQPQSCEAAFAALAAQKQNQFWNYHDKLFASDLAADEKSLTSIAKNMGLNMEKWELDRHSTEVQEQLSADIKVAYEIGINATPSVFINGRQVSNFNENVLTLLIQNELDKTPY